VLREIQHARLLWSSVVVVNGFRMSWCRGFAVRSWFDPAPRTVPITHTGVDPKAGNGMPSG
jgi:hypothetical protein